MDKSDVKGTTGSGEEHSWILGTTARVYESPKQTNEHQVKERGLFGVFLLVGTREEQVRRG